ncbi:Highly reducing polyketide synthase gloL [Cladobotryum mycophilum]|uniref:Highly reducing polyketide synthase gloL n=1 Tax=Cladobotryum mycophilum TaxID=491253 RepID=A0ABR0SIT5_9HYPO
MTTTRDPPPPIAIIGMGVRLPGGVSTPDEFWDLLINKRDGRCRVPLDRYNVDGFLNSGIKRYSVASEYGYFLKDADFKAFDTSFFVTNRTEAPTVDPQQRLLLEVVWECIENAGQTKLNSTNTGVFVGTFGEDWHDILLSDKSQSIPYRTTSGGDFTAANRISYNFDLRGPSITIRTACSASMTALHMACQSLYNGDCPTAIVAGASVIMNPTMTIDMTQQGALSPTGSCKTFDATADGFARGEAVNAILIKPLESALRDGDPIRAVIRSTALNADGKLSPIGVPSIEAQEMLIRHAYNIAGITDFSQTAFFECHGTGTLVGDPIEAKAVAKVFGAHGVYIGSVKPNVGHTEGASGLTSIIKATLALEHNTIPPNINFSKPNPDIPFDECKLRVPVEPVPWPKDKQGRISVNSFGIGGSNSHVIIESAKSYGMGRSKQANVNGNGEATKAQLNGTSNATVNSHTNGHTNGVPKKPVNETHGGVTKPWPHLLPISTSNSKTLQKRVSDLTHYIESQPDSLHSVAHTLGAHRVHLLHRTFCVFNGSAEKMEVGSFEKASTVSPEAVFVFTGQGAQWAGMGSDLIHGSPSFREDIRTLDETLQGLEEPPQWTIENILLSNDNHSILNKAEYSQPLCTAVQIALVSFLARCGITPSMVVGHSSGEIAAAYAAGAMTMSESILCSYFRGLAMTRQTRVGGMAAIGLSRAAVLPYLMDGVTVACENSSLSVTISGDIIALEQALDAIKAKEPDVFTRRLPVDQAYHSHHMCDVGEIYEEMLMPYLAKTEARVPFYSTVTGQAATKMQFGPAYWRKNLESPVLFHDAVRSLLKGLQNKTTILEIGPHSALKGPIRQILQEQVGSKHHSYVPTMLRDKDSAICLLSALGRLYTLGHSVDFSFINPGAPILTNLPNYPWDHSVELWDESRLSKEWRQTKYPYHEILGSRCWETSGSEPIWRSVIHLHEVPWLKDHKIINDVVFPCAGYIAMMGEAIRQFLGSDSYTLRDLMVKAALVVPGMEAVEMITTMKPTPLTEHTNSSWYNISISSFNGTSWVQNCTAQGRPCEDDAGLSQRKPIDSYPRHISDEFFYERMEYAGLNYGPCFRGLKDISVHTQKHRARATIRNDESEHASTYSAHPTAIDFCLQLSILARTKGIIRNLDSLEVPHRINHIQVNSGGPELVVGALVQLDSVTGKTRADIRAISKENIPVIQLDGVTGISLDTGKGASKQVMKKAIEKATVASILRILDVLKTMDITPSGYLSKLVSWMKAEKESMIQGKLDALVPEAREWASSADMPWLSLVDNAIHEINASGDVDAIGMSRMYSKLVSKSNIQAIYAGKMNPLQLIIDDGALEGFYTICEGSVEAEFFSLYAHSQPTLRVLELGAGTGAATRTVLKHLISKDGHRMFSEYVFTDISSGFFNAAQENFKDWEGLRPGYYDLIVASNVLHVTSSLQKTLQNVHSLLRPGGRLYLQELSSPMGLRTVNFITGHFPGWWADRIDNRLDTPVVTVERWNRELCDTGFSGAEVAVPDDVPQYCANVHIISTKLSSVNNAKAVTLLYYKEKHGFAMGLASRLEQDGITVDWRKLSDGNLPGQDTISTIDLEGPFFDEISEEDYGEFKAYVSRLKDGMLWLTRSAQVACTDPRYALVLGLARTVRKELSLDFWTVELETLDAAAAECTAALYQRFHNRHSLPQDRNIDYEFAVYDGTVNVGRHHWLNTSLELEGQVRELDPKLLTISRFGMIDSLHWVQHPEAFLQPDEVEIKVLYTGLNFRVYIMLSMSFMPGAKDKFGFEASGIIIRTGSAVEDFKVGDRVFALSDGLFATRRVLSTNQVALVPAGLSLENAATMPIVYMTVIYSLINLGQLTKGQSILIHSASGGVGIAAIYICKMLGAEIYTTVGNEDKAQHLVNTYGIPRERIFNSRNTSFLNEIMKATGGQGVDMVLNSLSGELLHASWQCVARYGKMLEIGKRDIIERGRLALDQFEGNRAYFGIDLSSYCRERPECSKRLMGQFVQYYNEGHIKPIQPISSFKAEDISNGFRFMKMGQHMGKIIIAFPDDSREIPSIKAPQPSLFSSTATYLLVGGLGGIGKAITTWLVENGARSFVFLSRSAGKPAEDQAFIRELEYQSCCAITVAGSVGELADVQSAVQSAPTPIAGVFQMSMALRDLAFSDITHDDWRTVQEPKVKGTWNLHNALSEIDLDFFILFSSLSGLFGRPGQANYASANTFLDAFVQYRHRLRLPCSVIDIGLVQGVGFLTNNTAMLKQFVMGGGYAVQEQEVIEAIQVSIRQSLPATTLREPNGRYKSLGQLAIGLRSGRSLHESSNLSFLKGDIRTDMYWQLAATSQVDTDEKGNKIRTLINAVSADPAILDDPELQHQLTWEIGRVICSLMMIPEENLDVTTTLESMGIDSLVSIEIRNWWRQKLGVEVSVLEIKNAAVIGGLGKLAVSALKKKYAEGDGDRGGDDQTTSPSLQINGTAEKETPDVDVD